MIFGLMLDFCLSFEGKVGKVGESGIGWEIGMDGVMNLVIVGIL